MAQANESQVERRRSAQDRAPFRRDNARRQPQGAGPGDRHVDPRLPDRMFDRRVLTTAGCGSASPGCENQRCRVAWHCEEFIGLEFETPLSEAVFERLLQDQQQLPESAILASFAELPAARTGWLGKAGNSDIAILADISRQCAEHAVIEGLRLKAPKRP